MVDRYTKIVLTVIAFALLAIASENAVPSAHAQLGGPQKVQICDDLQHCADLRPTADVIPNGPTITTWALTVSQQAR